MAERELLLLGIVVSVAALARLVAHLLRLPASAGYVAAGFLAQPLLPPDVDLLETLLRLALYFLLFVAGTHFGRLRATRRILTRAGLVGLSGSAAAALLAVALAYAHGWVGRELLYVAAVAGFSSTLLAVQWMDLVEDLSTAHRNGLLAALLVQDALALLLIATAPYPAEPAVLARGLGAVLLLVAIAALVHLAARRPVVWRQLRDAETRVLATFGLAFAFLLGATALGVPPAAGALLAGLAVAGFPTRVYVRPAITTARQFFVPVFLVALGALFPLPTAQDLPLLAGLLVAILIAKPLVTAMAARASGLHKLVAARVGSLTGQGGELGLALAIVALDTGDIAPERFSVLGLAIAASFLLSPLLRGPLTVLIAQLVPGRPTPSEPPREDHVLMLGAGTTGRALSHELARLEVQLAAVDGDAHALALLPVGTGIVQGDATDLEVLRSAGAATARGIVVLLDDDATTARALAAIARLRPRPDQVRIARVERSGSAQRIAALGAVPLRTDSATADRVLAHVTRTLGDESRQGE